MVVQALGHQLKGERILLAAGLLDLGPFVLEPNLNLRLVQSKFSAQLLSPLLGQVSIFVEFVLQEREEEDVNRRPLVNQSYFRYVSHDKKN